MTVTINGTTGITTPSLSSNNGVTATNALTGSTLNTTGAATVGGILNANGGQIKFPASQVASADANTLDDYEEGTWTPAWGATSGSMTYATQVGRYTKVGRLVVATCHIITSANNAFTGNLYLSGLPFAADPSGSNYVPCAMHVENVNLAASAWIWCHVNPNLTTANVRYWSNNAPAASLGGSSLNAGSDIMVTCTYNAA